MFERRVEIRADVVIKTHVPELMRVEVEKLRRAYRIAQGCGLFRVPRVLDYDDRKGEVVLERLHDIRPVCNTLANGGMVCDGLLAAIHNELTLPDEMRTPLPPEVSMPGSSEVFLHGDFNTHNVFVRRCGAPIVILDWCTTACLGERATFGTRYFDLAWFVTVMFDLPVHRYPFCEPPGPRARVFLRSYFRAADYVYNEAEMRRYMKAFLGLQRAAWKCAPWRKRVTLAPRWARLRAFMETVRL
jgi:hypothetical protein